MSARFVTGFPLVGVLDKSNIFTPQSVIKRPMAKAELLERGREFRKELLGQAQQAEAEFIWQSMFEEHADGNAAAPM